MKVIGKIIDVIFNLVEWICAILFAVLVALTFIQVCARFFHTSATWTEEIVNFSMIWVAMLGACILMRLKGHMAIDNLSNALHGIAKAVFNLISVGFQVLFLISMVIGYIDYFPKVSAQRSPALQLNMGIIYSIFLIAPVIMLLGLVDYWVVKKGQTAGYSEEDELLKQVQAENAADEEG